MGDNLCETLRNTLRILCGKKINRKEYAKCYAKFRKGI